MRTLSETGVWVEDIVVPEDGVDFRLATSLSDNSLQSLANRTRALYEFLAELAGTVALPANLSVAGSINSHGTLTASAAFHCAGAASFDNTCTHAGNIAANGGITGTTIHMTDRIATTERLQAAGIDISGDAELHTCGIDYLAVAVNAQFNASSTFTGPVELQSVATCTGAGRVVRAGRYNYLATGAGSLDPAVCNTWYFDTLTGDVNMTLTGGEGDEHEVTNKSGSHFVNLLLPGGGALTGLIYGTGGLYYARVKKIAGTWRLLMALPF